jgi:hypothetical protein
MKSVEPVTINIFEQVGGSAAVSSDDGEAIFNYIVKALHKKMKIILDFNNIELITSTFLNTAVGQLYSKYDSPFLNEHLQVENMAKEDIQLLKKVVERAKEYFKNKEKVDKIIQESLNDEEDY